MLLWLLMFPAMSHFFLVMSPPFNSLLGDCLKITTNSSVRQILSAFLKYYISATYHTYPINKHRFHVYGLAFLLGGGGDGGD